MNDSGFKVYRVTLRDGRKFRVQALSATAARTAVLRKVKDEGFTSNPIQRVTDITDLDLGD